MDKMNFVCFIGKADIMVALISAYETLIFIIPVADDPTDISISSGITITIFI